MVLDCFCVLNDVELSKEERLLACLLIFYEDFNIVEDVLSVGEETYCSLANKAFTFFNCGQAENPNASSKNKLIDWEEDAQLISSGINKVAGKEVRSEPYVHWWTFMGYFNAIGEGALSTIVGIRNKLAKGKKLEKYELEFKRENPQYFSWDMRTLQQKEEDELLAQIWNKE